MDSSAGADRAVCWPARPKPHKPTIRRSTSESIPTRIRPRTIRIDLGRSSNGNGSRTEVIQRGGSGAFHGNVEFLLRDDALNARNPFANNKPDSQERQLRIDASGPVIRRRLTSQALLFPERVRERRHRACDATRRPVRTRDRSTHNDPFVRNHQHVATRRVPFARPQRRILHREGRESGRGRLHASGAGIYDNRTTAGIFPHGIFRSCPAGSLFESRFGLFRDSTETIPVTDATRRSTCWTRSTAEAPRIGPKP